MGCPQDPVGGLVGGAPSGGCLGVYERWVLGLYECWVCMSAEGLLQTGLLMSVECVCVLGVYEC